MSISSEISRISSEVSDQEDLIEQIEIALQSKAAGGVEVIPVTISENGTTTAPSGKAYNPVTVSVPRPSGSITLTANGSYNISDYETAVVSLPVYDGSVT